MGAQVVSFVRRQSAPVDWTRDEIAELYRIEHALVQSGLTLDVERGVTDEGDPWFVFCRADGEVLIHLARYDGFYHLHSPALSSPLIGRSFVELTKEFSSRVPLQITLQRNSGARLFVHPAAMLAVVIGAIFAASNDVVLSPQALDSEKKLDAPSESASTHKAFLQSTFQLYIENFVSWLRDGAVVQQAAHLSLISTIAVFIIGSDTATDTDRAGEGPSVVTNAKSAAEVSDALLAALASTNDATHRTADKLADHSAASQDLALLGPDDGQKAQESTASMDYTQIAVVSHQGDVGQPNKIPDANTDMSNGAISTSLTTIAASEVTNDSGLQPDSSMLLSVVGSGETPGTAQSDTLDVVLSGTSQNIDLSSSLGVHELVLSGDGEVYVSGIADSAPLSIYVTSGSQEDLFLSYQAIVAGPFVTQTVTLNGADTVSLTEVLKSNTTAVQLTVDSEGSQANTLNLVDPTSEAGASSGTFTIKLVGSQALTVNESAVTFNNSSLDDSGLAANLTVGIDFSGGTVSVTDLTVGASNFVVNQSDSVALVGLTDNSQIVFDTSLASVILSMSANSAAGGVSLDLQPSSQTAIEIANINALSLTSLSIESNSGGLNQANEIVGLVDANLSVLTITGNGALTIGSIYGVADTDDQNITIDAHALTAPFTLNVSGIDDTSAGGRVITIIGGSDGSVLTNMVASEDTVFTGGAGVNTYNIGGGAILDAITDLKATDMVNIGSASVTDSFVNALRMNSVGQTLVNSQNDLVDAALAASTLLAASAAHQAVLFSYQGNEYVFVNAAGGGGFNASVDAIVKVVGLSAQADLAGVFHSA